MVIAGGFWTQRIDIDGIGRSQYCDYTGWFGHTGWCIYWVVLDGVDLPDGAATATKNGVSVAVVFLWLYWGRFGFTGWFIFIGWVHLQRMMRLHRMGDDATPNGIATSDGASIPDDDATSSASLYRGRPARGSIQ